MRARKIDDNQKAIVDALRKIGCSVAITSGAGDGFPDLVVGRTNVYGERENWLLEVKDGNKPPSQQKLTDKQINFHKQWKGQIDVVRDSFEAVNLVLRYQPDD